MGALNESTAVEEAAFDSLVRTYRPKIFRYALASLRDKDAADTIAQDCMMKAYRARDSFRQECSLDTWLMQIAVNLVRDHLRNRRLRFWKQTQSHSETVEELSYRLDDGRRTPEEQASLKQQVASVWAATGKLSDRQRTVFLLRFVEDMEILDIATATGMAEGTVKTHLFRALQAVREQLGVTK